MSGDGAGAPSRRKIAAQNIRREGAPPPFRHLAHVASFRDNPIVYFTVCTQQRQKILATPECHQILRGVWERSAEHDGWWVGHYILMPDHVHFFARPEIDAKPMRKWIGMWKSVSSRQIATELQIAPPIWQADYFDRYLRTSESYSAKWAYVEQNAVRAGLAETVDAWPYRGVIHDLRL
jgi:putative transposase